MKATGHKSKRLKEHEAEDAIATSARDCIAEEVLRRSRQSQGRANTEYVSRNLRRRVVACGPSDNGDEY